MTSAGVDVLTPRSVEPFRADAVWHAGAPGRRSADAGVQTGSCGAPGAQSGLADRAAVPRRTEALERAVARVQTESAVSARTTLTRIRSIFARLAGESRIA